MNKEELEKENERLHEENEKLKKENKELKKRLTFSNELLNQTFEERAKVIVHELLHLKYPKHNTMFNALLTSYLNKKGIKCSIKL